MSRPFTVLLALAVLAPLPLAAAPAAPAANGPQSYVDGNPQTKNNPQIAAVRIITVDGERPLNVPFALPPGPHWIEAVPQTASAAQAPKSQSFVLKIQPCTYYYLAARRNPVVQGSWKMIVDAEETITSCNPADELRKARTATARPQPTAPTPPASGSH